MVRRLAGPVKKGFHRVAWDLRFPATHALEVKAEEDDDQPIGVMAAPGDYTVSLAKQVDGVVTDLSKPVPFKVERMRKGVLDGADPRETAAFWQQLAQLQRSTTAASLVIEKTLTKVDVLQTALSRTPAAPGGLDKQLHQLKQALLELDEQLNGNRSKRQVGETKNPTILFLEVNSP